ncbi:MAG: PAS domain-containing protein [Phycisphaerales bacterium]|nr:MAG: PAS domain-containing protein [Phycisphaerales bacterium]
MTLWAIVSAFAYLAALAWSLVLWRRRLAWGTGILSALLLFTAGTQVYESTRDTRPFVIALDLGPREASGLAAGALTLFLVALLANVTSQGRQAEQRLARVYRALRARGRCNTALIRAKGEKQLLEEVCQIIVEEAGYRLAWVGFAECDEAKTVRPVVQAGCEEGYLDTLSITWADTERGRGPTGTAIRTGQPRAARHIHTDAMFAPWRAEALKRGYASSIALPLRADGQTFGALNVYSEEPDAFDAEEEQLLISLADDLAYGIVGLRARADRERVQKALRESEERFRELYDTMSSGVAVYRPKEDGSDFIFTGMNRAGLRIDNIREEQIVGRSVLEAFPSVREIGLFDVFQRVFRTGIPDHLPARLYDDGRVSHWVENYVYKLPSGEIVAIYDDVTARVEAEQKRRQQEMLLRNIISNIPSAVFWKNTESVYEGCNWAFARAAGLSNPDQVVGKTDYDMPWKREHADRLRRHDRRVIKEGSPLIRVEETLRHADSTEHIILGSRVPRRDAQGHVCGILGIHTDITDRKEAEETRAKLQEQLHHAQKLEAVGQLAGGMAHDFSNLLQVILSGTEKLRGHLGDEAACEAYGMIEQACTEATGLARSLLTFSHRLPIEKEPIQLGSLLQESTRLIRRMLPAAIEVVLETCDDSVTILADRTQMQQVLLNLAINARDAMPEGGTLRFALERAAAPPDALSSPAGQSPTPWARLTVSDTGSGIAPEIQKRIFEPFFTTKPRGQGSGLGLTIVREIVQQHRAQMELRSRQDHGTTFAFHWPCIDPSAIPKESQVPGEQVRGQGELILLAEDQRYVREIIASTLQSLGYGVLQAADGAQLLDLYRSHREDIRLLMIDADLPKRPGTACLKEIRLTDPLTPAVILTGSPDEQHDDAYDELTVILRKPFQMSDLGRLVCRLVNPRQLEESQT